MDDRMCEGRVLEFGDQEEKNNPSLADLTLGHSVESYVKVGWGEVGGIVFDNGVVLLFGDNGDCMWYDNRTKLEFDLYRVRTNCFGQYFYYISKDNAEEELEHARIRAKRNRMEWPDADPNDTVTLVHLSITPYKMRKLEIKDLDCGFYNQRKNWAQYLEDVRNKADE